jgi:Uma2 family endonuclease
MTIAKPVGAWTYEDLLSLPDDGRRYEIIEGVLYEMPSPSLDHATTVLNLVLLLAPVIQSLGGRLFIAPLDVFFPGADPVQPDIMAMLPGWRGALEQRGPQGSPDLVIEVISPSTRGHDLLTKRALYGRAGVREYWLVDPTAQSIEVLVLRHDVLHTAQRVAGDEAMTSPLLGNTSLSLAAIFAGVGEVQA